MGNDFIPTQRYLNFVHINFVLNSLETVFRIHLIRMQLEISFTQFFNLADSSNYFS